MSADTESPGDDRASEIIDASADSADSIDAATAAELLGVTERTVTRRAASGLLSGHKVRGTYGPEWRVSRAEVEAEIAQGEDGSADSGSPSVRPKTRTDTAVVRRLDANTEALQELGDRLWGVRALSGLPGELQELRETIRENTDGQAAATAAIGRLIDEVQAARAERDALAQQLEQAREELAAERARPWWQRIGRA